MSPFESESHIDVNDLFLIACEKQDEIISRQKTSKREISPRIAHLQDQFHGKLYDLVQANVKAPETLGTIPDAPESLTSSESIPNAPEDKDLPFSTLESTLDHCHLFWLACAKNRQKLYSKHRPRREVELPLRVEHLNIMMLRKLRDSKPSESSRKRSSTSEAPPTPAKQAKIEEDFSNVSYISQTAPNAPESFDDFYHETQNLLDIENEEEAYQLKKKARAEARAQGVETANQEFENFIDDLFAEEKTTDEEDFEWFNTFFAASE